MPAISARFRASVSTRSARHSPPAPEPHDRFFYLPSHPAGLSRALDNFLTRHRIGVWRVVVTFVLASLLFGHSRWDGTWVSPLLLTLGMLGVSLATVGRLWCALYISGRKNNTLVTSGPYSLCRHPLYVCNLLGILGLGAMTESLAVTAVLALAFALMYPAVIRTEDRFLASAFPEFAEYARRTPAFFPRLSLYRGSRHGRSMCLPFNAILRTRSGFSACRWSWSRLICSMTPASSGRS